MNKLKKQLLNLAIGELVATFMFIYLYTSLNFTKIGMANLIAFLYLLFILLQGSSYWLYRYILLSKGNDFGCKAIKFFKQLKWLNIVLLILIGITLPVTMKNYKDLLITIILLLFGIIEYINYYWYRLSYGKSGFNIRILLNTKLQKSSLNKLISK